MLLVMFVEWKDSFTLCCKTWLHRYLQDVSPRAKNTDRAARQGKITLTASHPYYLYFFLSISLSAFSELGQIKYGKKGRTAPPLIEAGSCSKISARGHSICLS